jgi:hypothetical protein
MPSVLLIVTPPRIPPQTLKKATIEHDRIIMMCMMHYQWQTADTDLIGRQDEVPLNCRLRASPQFSGDLTIVANP